MDGDRRVPLGLEDYAPVDSSCRELFQPSFIDDGPAFRNCNVAGGMWSRSVGFVELNFGVVARKVRSDSFVNGHSVGRPEVVPLGRRRIEDGA